MDTKKFGGTIRNWQLHTVLDMDTEEAREQIQSLVPEMLEDKGYVFTGTVVDDPLGRWEPGFHMRSSLVLRIDRENGIIETLHTIYKVQDEGGDVFQDMGKSIMSVFY